MASSDENAETDEQLESALARFLTPVLLKLDSKEDGVMELLVHVNKRLKSLTRVQLPVDDLINFTVIYIKLGFPRLEPEKQGERVPALLSCLEGRSQSQQDSMDQRREMFACITTPAMSKLLLTYMLDLLLVPYGSHAKIAELQQAQTRRPATAPASNTPNPIAPPGLSITSFRRVMGDNPYQPEQLEKVKLGIVKFLGGDLFTEKDVVCHYIVGAADTRHRTVDLNDSDILTKLFAIILGTLEFKGQTPIKPEFKVMQACTRIRMKIMPYILKARESANTFPCNIQDRKVLSLAYVALGKLVHRFPQLVATNIALVQVFFDVMCQVDSDMRLAVQEALSLMANAFKDLSELNQKMMVALLMEAIDKEEPQARMMAVQYAEKIFPKDHVASRYILLLAAGDQKEDIRLEAVKGLHAAQGDEKLTSRPVEPAAKVVLPDFSKMVEFVKEKADIRVTTQNRVVISNSTLPFNQTTFTEILLYLRSCLAHSASLVPDMDGVSAMKEQAPEISKYVQGLMKENNTDRGPVQTYVNLTQMLLKAVGGSTPMYCLLEMVAMAPTELTTVFSMKDDIRDLAANLYAIIVCKHTDEGQLLEALEFMLNSMNNKSLEAQHGAILTLGHLIARLVKVTDENNPMLAAGACQAIGEIGRNAPLPLPSGSEGELEGEITKLSVVKNLLAIIKSGKENTKSKQIELHFTLGEALVFAAQGPTSPAGRDLWTQTEEEWKAIANYSEDEVEWYLTTVLERYVTSANPHVRQASSVWLLALVKKCNLTQDISSKGLGLVYEICSTEQKSALVSELVDTLMTGKRKQQTVSADTQVFEEGSIGKTPEGSGLSTYKELCSIANELNQPDLIYKFMHLANHHAMWNSRKGAAFGFTTIAAQAGEQLAPFLPQIVPRLYRYQFDPNMKIQQAMTSIWNALVQDNKNTVDKYMKEILADLLTNLTNNQWRIRESSCLAVHDLLRGHALDDVVESLPELWESCLRASIKICDVSYGKVGERATTVVLPCLLKCGLQSPVSEVRALGLSTILKISKNAGVLLKPHIPVLVTALLEAISGLEPQVMNYLSLDNARIMASKMSPMMETVNLCVQYVDESVLPEMVPRLTELIKSGKLMGAFLNGVADRNMAVRKSYALALGHLVRIAKDSSVEKLITRMRSWYLEKEEEAAHNGCGLTLHAISQQSSDILKRHASLTMPLAFLAMHELAKDGSSNKGDDSLSLWEEVWTEVTPGTEGGIKLYLAEIVSLLQETIQSQSWATKAQAARAISTVADKLGAKLGPPHLGNLIEALLLGLQGRTWAGKIIEDLLRESRKESIKYKLEALTCLGEVVEIFEVDRFQDVYAILAPVIEKKEEDMEVDEEKEELNSDVKEGQLVCYYTVLGQIWPIGARNTQEARLEGISCLLCEALQGNTRKIQEAIMKTMHKVINRKTEVCGQHNNMKKTIDYELNWVK
ncbi:ECM29-like protein [Mya arenaria]|uniref:ECM29-like protein n=1 Tax=Mya arenaria TaxID=6604 RepID=A0ABY7FR93_MYAAR|nr:ECM29-like protein [Mya arenaria]